MHEGQRVAQEASRTKSEARPWGDDAETESFVSYWFGAPQRQMLAALAIAVISVKSASVRLALQVAISRIIVTKTPQASLAADTAHSRPHKVLNSSDYDVISGFRGSVTRLARLLDAREHIGSGEVILGDARSLEGINENEADLVVTSPPYLNALDYLRGHKLALVWFGYTTADLRQRRANSIGTQRALLTELAPDLLPIMKSMTSAVKTNDTLPTGMLRRYVVDCYGFVNQLARVLKPSGQAVLVVGNSTIRGNYIRTDLAIQAVMELSGFKSISRYERPIPTTHRYMAIDPAHGSSTIQNRMRTEVILTMGKQEQTL